MKLPVASHILDRFSHFHQSGWEWREMSRVYKVELQSQLPEFTNSHPVGIVVYAVRIGLRPNEKLQGSVSGRTPQGSHCLYSSKL